MNEDIVIFEPGKGLDVNGGAVMILGGIFGLMVLLVQRTEVRHRRLALILTLFISLLMLYWANGQALGRELLVGLFLALILNFLFWLLIGRYNPVGDSDKAIQVLGMDD